MGRLKNNLFLSDLLELGQLSSLNKKFPAGAGRSAYSSDKVIGNYGKCSIAEKTYKNVILNEWNSYFYNNIEIGGSYANNQFGLCFATQGTFCIKQNSNNHNVQKRVFSANENAFYSIEESTFGKIEYKGKNHCTTSMILINDDLLKILTNNYPELLSDFFKRHYSGETYFSGKRNFVTTPEMQLILEQINNAPLMGNISSMYVEIKIAELLALQLQQLQEINEHVNSCVEVNVSKISKEKIFEAKHILLSNINTPPTIKELSTQVGMNQDKLKREFKAVFGETIYNCLFEYKMELANRFLVSTDHSISEIALKCGYDYTSHFTTAFKRKFGVSPSEFRVKKNLHFIQ